MQQSELTAAGRTAVELLIRKRAAQHPEATWLYWQDSSYTWAEVLSASRRFAVALRELGVRSGDRVALMLPNGPEFLWAHFGVLFAGALSVPVNTSQRGATLRYILANSAPMAVVFADEFRPLVMQTLPTAEPQPALISLGGTASGPVARTVDDMLSAPEADLDLSDAPAGGVGIMYTSGTTGPPKGVVSTAYDITSLEILLRAGDIRPGDTMYTPLPLYHGNALTVSAVGSMVADARLALGARFSASRFWDEVRRYGASEFNALGAMIAILLKQPVRSDDADNPVRAVLSAGAPSDARWTQFEQRFGVRLVEWFGMVDSPGTLLNDESRVGSMGRPIGGVQFRVVGPDDSELGPGQVGELVFRHPAGRLTHYHDNREATEHAYRGGWFHSGDLAERDADGFFYYRGRLKESMRRRGENISAWEIESAVIQHPDVVECAAYGVASELGEDDVMLAAVRRPGTQLTPQELVAFCAEHMAAYALPRYVAFVDALPKTGTQRIQYAVLKARGTAGAWDREQPSATPEEDRS
jgi:crotonobetaine/carnitine-CoA ligase